MIRKIHCDFLCDLPKIASVWTFYGRRRFGVYGALDRTFGTTGMAYGDLILTEISAATTGSHFCPRPGPGMDSGIATADFYIDDWINCHPLFDGAAPCHLMSSGCLAAAPPGHLAAVVESICCKWILWWRSSSTRWTCHHLLFLCPLHGSVAVSLQVSLPDICATTSI